MTPGGLLVLCVLAFYLLFNLSDGQVETYDIKTTGKWSKGTVYPVRSWKTKGKAFNHTVGGNKVKVFPVTTSGKTAVGTIVKFKLPDTGKSFYGVVVSARKLYGFGLSKSSANTLKISTRTDVRWAATAEKAPIGTNAKFEALTPRKTTSGSGSTPANPGAAPGANPGAAPGGSSTSMTPLDYKGKTDWVLTWYSFQDNTPSNSSQSSSGRKLIPFISVAPPFRLLKKFGGELDYGDKLFVEFLRGRTMPNGLKHSGWVSVDDFCGDNDDDSYCFQNGKPSLDLYIGDMLQSGMKSGCVGPMGGGQENTKVYSGTPGPGEWIASYGGAEKASNRRCGDGKSGQADHKKFGCGFYGGDNNDSGC